MMRGARPAGGQPVTTAPSGVVPSARPTVKQMEPGVVTLPAKAGQLDPGQSLFSAQS